MLNGRPQSVCDNVLSVILLFMEENSSLTTFVLLKSEMRHPQHVKEPNIRARTSTDISMVMFVIKCQYYEYVND